MSLAPRLEQWRPAALESGARWGVDPALILAILERETRGGVANRPAGPAGTGDWKPRRWARYSKRPDPERFKRWFPSYEEHQKLFGPKVAVVEICMPADGLGWGRGLMQIDYADPANYAFLEAMLDGAPTWQHGPSNIDYGTSKLSALISMFDGREDFAAAAYNAGAERVRDAILGVTSPTTDWRRVKAADSVTTGQNYASDVMTMRERFRRQMQPTSSDKS